MPVTSAVPSIGARKPPVSFCVLPTFGLVQSRSGLQVADPLNQQVEHDRRADRAEQQPERTTRTRAPARSPTLHEALDSTALRLLIVPPAPARK